MAKNILPHCLLFCVFVLMHGISLAQFPVTLNLSAASGSAVETPATRTDARYRITVQGTYSQWPQFADCHGVDAVWVYDVPQEEVDALRWPPTEILGRPFVAIPHWVGDSTTYAFPPAGVGIDPLLEISFRKYLGFRINGEPMAVSPLDKSLHRYQQERAGTGSAFTFQILDSTYNVALGRVIPRYEDNCGELVVTVEEILDKDINICDVKPVVVNNQTVGIRLDAAVFMSDTDAVDGRRNILVAKEQLGVVDNGQFVCPDSLVCDSGRTTPLSIGLVLDVSGSMQEPVDYDGVQVTRLDAVKRTLHNFMRTLKTGDSLYLITFSTVVVLSQDWTADTAAVGRVIDALQPLEYTALHAAMITGLQKMANHTGSGRTLIVLTDGLNNLAPLEEEPVVAAIRSSNVPLYLIAFGFAQSAEELYGLGVMKRFVAAAPRGKLYEVHTGNELDNVYTEMASALETEDCCRLYFPLKPCDRGQRSRTISLVYLDGGVIIKKEIVLDCDFKTTAIGPTTTGDIEAALTSARPTPSNDIALVQVRLTRPSNVTVAVVNQLGDIIEERDLGIMDIGRHDVRFDTSTWQAGMYICRSWNGMSFTSTKILIKH